MALGRAFKIGKKQATGYGYAKPNPGVSAIAAVNGRGAYSARQAMANKTGAARRAHARRRTSQMTAVEKAAFAKKMRAAHSRLRPNATRAVSGRKNIKKAQAARRDWGRGLKRGHRYRVGKPAYGSSPGAARKLQPGVYTANRRSRMLKKNKKRGPKSLRRRRSAAKRPATRRRRRTAAKKTTRRRRRRPAAKKTTKRRRRRAAAKKTTTKRRRRRPAAKKTTKRRRSRRKMSANSTKRRRRRPAKKTTKRRRRRSASKRTTKRRRRSKMSANRRRHRSNKRRHRSNRHRGHAKRRHHANKRRHRSNKRRHRSNKRHAFRRNEGFMTTLMGGLKIGAVVLAGIAAHKVVSKLLSDVLLDKVLGSAVPTATAPATAPAVSGLEVLQPYKRIIAGALTAGIGILATNMAVKDANTKTYLIAGMAGSFLHTLVVDLLTQFGGASGVKAASYLSGYQDSTAASLGASIMPHYMPVGEYFDAGMNGMGEYFESGMAGLGNYGGNPDIYQAAAGMGAMQNQNSGHVDPAGDLDRELTLAEAAAGIGAASYEAQAGLGEFMGGANRALPARSTWVPGTTRPDLWAAVTGVSKPQGATSSVPAGVLQTAGGAGVFG